MTFERRGNPKMHAPGRRDTDDLRARVNVGDTVTLIGVPPGLRDDDDLQTKSLFDKCLGKTFVVKAIDTIEGLPHPMIELHVGHVEGGEDFEQSIWVEPQYLERVGN